MSAINKMMGGVKWKAEIVEASDSDLPFVTHSGVIDVLGAELRCYRLSNGQTIIDGDDFDSFMDGIA